MSEQNKAKVSLHLDGKVIGAGPFVRGVRAFIGLIEEVSAPFGKNLQWGVSVRQGSNVMDVQHIGTPESSLLAMECLGVIEEGLEAIENRVEMPKGFSTSAIQRAGRLAEVVQQVGGHVQGPTKQCILTSQTAANVNKLLGSPCSAIGSIEGELLLISDVSGLKIGIRDTITGRIIRCSFESGELHDLATQFHKRISVRGVIEYRIDGSVSKIEVETYRVLRETGQLPSADDVRGILRDH